MEILNVTYSKTPTTNRSVDRYIHNEMVAITK